MKIGSYMFSACMFIIPLSRIFPLIFFIHFPRPIEKSNVYITVRFPHIALFQILFGRSDHINIMFSVAVWVYPATGEGRIIYCDVMQGMRKYLYRWQTFRFIFNCIPSHHTSYYYALLLHHHDPVWPDGVFTGRATGIHYDDLYTRKCACVCLDPPIRLSCERKTFYSHIFLTRCFFLFLTADAAVRRFWLWDHDLFRFRQAESTRVVVALQRASWKSIRK